MKKVLLLFAFISSYFMLFSQDCPDFDNAIRRGDNAKDYKVAYQYYDLAEDIACNVDLKKRAKQKKDALFEKINNLREEAVKAKTLSDTLRNQANRDKERAILSQRQAEEQKAIATAALDQVKEADARNQKIIAAFYFYKNQYALAFNDGKYGFIDKEGNDVIPYKYDEVIPFNSSTGYARVKRNGKWYLLDTDKNEYDLATDMDALNSGITAFESDQQSNIKFSKLLKQPQLKIITISGKISGALPKDINKLSNLESLILPSGNLSTVPNTIGDLKNLYQLNLSNSNLKDLPTTISELKELRSLVFSNTNLAFFPLAITELRKLEYLNLSNNKLQEIPGGIGLLEKLQILDLSNNNLKTLPSTLKDLTHLKSIYLSGSLNVFSEEEKKRIQMLVPNCKIHW